MDCKVYPYSYKYEPKTMPLINSVIYYYHPVGNKCILRVNQALVMFEGERILICPLQTRDNELVVEDFSHQFEKYGRRISHYTVLLQSGLDFLCSFME